MKYLLITIITIAASFSTYSTVYKWKGKDGVTYFSENPPSNAEKNIENLNIENPNIGKKIDKNFIINSQLKKMLVYSQELVDLSDKCLDAAIMLKANNKYCKEYSNKMNNQDVVDSLDKLSSSNGLSKKQNFIWQDISTNIRKAEAKWNRAVEIFNK